LRYREGKGVATEAVNFVYFCCFVLLRGGPGGEEIRDPRACSAGTDGGMTHAASCWWGSASRQSREAERQSKRGNAANTPTSNLLAKTKNRNNGLLFSFFCSRANPFILFDITSFTVAQNFTASLLVLMSSYRSGSCARRLPYLPSAATCWAVHVHFSRYAIPTPFLPF
jgi:hypothetical protein